VAAKAKITNLSRPNNLHGVSIGLHIPIRYRPQKVLDTLDLALQGSGILLRDPPPRVLIKQVSEGLVEYETSGYVATLDNKAKARNQLYDLAHRHLEAASISLSDDTHSWSRPRNLIEHLKIFHSLSENEKDRLSEQMTAIEYSTGQIILGLGDLPDHLSVISSGVVLVEVLDGDTMLEVGRMGPGEIMGEQSILTDTPSVTRCTALTNCMLYKIDKATLQGCMMLQTDIESALTRLLTYREQHTHASLAQKPSESPKRGFFNWLHKG
jgi:CRP-like cAMP-binding protein